MDAGYEDGLIRVADWLMDALAERGVRHVFMVAGGGAMYLNDAAGLHPELETVSTLHEQAAAIACEAYVKASGHLPLCLVTTGPGSTNAITGVTAAWLDSVPMIVVSGQVKRPDLVGTTGVRQRGVQEVNTPSMVRAITKEVVMVTDPTKIRYHFERAMYLATSGRPGPVWLDIPLDVQAARIDPATLEAFDPSDFAFDEDQSDAVSAGADRIMEILGSAHRPVILLGAGVLHSQAQARALRLVERLGVPVLSTWPAQGIVGDDHPLFVGRPGALASRGANFAVQNSDGLICLGTRLDMATTGYDQKDFGRHARKVVVDIDPAELAKLEGAIELGVRADVGLVIDELMRRVSNSASPAWNDVDGWFEQCQTWKKRYPIVTDEHRQAGEFVTTYHLADVISDLLEPDDVLATCCSGLGIEIFLLALRLRTGQRPNCNFSLGAMGFGPPTAVGACIGSGMRRTICVDGDGGLQLNVQELETIRRLQLPIKLFVMANEGYASIRASQTRWFGRVVGADPSSGVTVPPLDKLAEAYGLPFVRLDGRRELHAQIRSVFEHEGPIICEVPAPPSEPREPTQTSEALPDGGMRSRPLEDLAPLLDREELAANMFSDQPSART